MLLPLWGARSQAGCLPNPDADVCALCHAKDPTIGHDCSPKCQPCGLDHPTASKDCRKKLRPPPPRCGSGNEPSLPNAGCNPPRVTSLIMQTTHPLTCRDPPLLHPNSVPTDNSGLEHLIHDMGERFNSRFTALDRRLHAIEEGNRQDRKKPKNRISPHAIEIANRQRTAGAAMWVDMTNVTRINSSNVGHDGLCPPLPAQERRPGELNVGELPVSWISQTSYRICHLPAVTPSRRLLREHSVAPARPGDRKRLQKATYADVWDVLLKGFVDARTRNIPISGPMTLRKARDFAFMLDFPDVCPGNGWLHRFERRHGIVFKSIVGEAASARKSKKQRCFMSYVPVRYRYNAKAWITPNLFAEWLSDFNREGQGQGRRVLFVIDNCSAPHMQAFLTARCSAGRRSTHSRLRSRRRADFERPRHHYNNDRERQARHFSEPASRAPPTTRRKRFPIVTSTCVRNSLLKAGFVDTQPGDEPDASVGQSGSDLWQRVIDSEIGGHDLGWYDFVCADENADTAEPCKDQGIVNEVLGKSDAEESDADDDETSDPAPISAPVAMGYMEDLN
ncbi:hypothetical protein HPB48_019264 [Haemaphysalis longicornis]|uniref:HTH CENPB-type domain-containing protein n=1 Tax=Haemaphysalis longicornis TaxID=44386 RepID=A0A9J6GCX9_HAELO|nr:hypothetical protein HPB48_019264 [Haemaphysalis longicornis]